MHHVVGAVRDELRVHAKYAGERRGPLAAVGGWGMSDGGELAAVGGWGMSVGCRLAAEQLAGLLRGAIEEDRDLVPVSEEWAFVERYLDIERIRFGDRLRVHVRLSEDARSALLPVVVLQKLVENAVRHGAAPRVEPTDIAIAGSVANGMLTLVVRDSGGGASDFTGHTRTFRHGCRRPAGA